MLLAKPSISLCVKNMQKTVDLCPALQHPFTCLVSGATQSGKTEWLFKLLTLSSGKIQPPPEQIIYCFSEEQSVEKFRNAKGMANIQFHKGIPILNEENEELFSSELRKLIILDDLMQEANSEMISTLFTRGSHHRNLSIILVTQNLFYQNKHFRTISLNANYLVIFKNPRDLAQINHLARQMFPGKSSIMQNAYYLATKQPYGYLFVDLKQTTPDNARLRTNIFDENGEGVVCDLFMPI